MSIRITASPIGPQPITTAVSCLRTSLRRTACQATAIGSVRAAVSALNPLGTSMVSDSWTSTHSAYAPGALADRPVICTSSPIRIIGSDDHRRACRPGLAGRRAVVQHPAAELVTHHDRLVRAHEVLIADPRGQVGELVGMPPGVQVGAADAAAHHLEPHLAGSRTGSGQLRDVELRLAGRQLPSSSCSSARYAGCDCKVTVRLNDHAETRPEPADDLPEQMQVRREKRQRLLDSGRPAYPITVERTHTIREIREKYDAARSWSRTPAPASGSRSPAG